MAIQLPRHTETTMTFRAGVLTISDKGSRGERVDTAGPAVAALLAKAGLHVTYQAVVPDERDQIADRLRQWAEEGLALVITAGGTGLSPRDVTPEATQDVVDRLVPGLPELIRESGRKSTPRAALGRGIAGVRGRTLILNLPGSERGATESLEAVLDLLPHALELLHGHTEHP